MHHSCLLAWLLLAAAMNATGANKPDDAENFQGRWRPLQAGSHEKLMLAEFLEKLDRDPLRVGGECGGGSLPVEVNRSPDAKIFPILHPRKQG